MRYSYWPILLALLLIARGAPAENHVLELDGNGSYVELQPNIFTNLTEATVEVWAKWNSFRQFSRVFEFGGPWQSMSLFNHDRFPDIRFNVYPHYAKDNPRLIYAIRARGLLRTNEWIHFAAVSGPGGMKLYVNGALVGEHTNEASFADIKVIQTNVFGLGLAKNPGDQDFRGQIDDVRVWDYRRSESQIREGMHKRLSGTESGLVALWNFEDGTANDASPHHFSGKLIGNARIVAAEIHPAITTQGGEPDTLSKASPVATTFPVGSDYAVWWIAGALTLIVLLLLSLVLMLRRRTVPATQLLPRGSSAAAALPAPSGAGTLDLAADQNLKERALAELTQFAKESLVQGLYSQRKALLETQQDAQRQLAELEARLSALRLPERIIAYEKRIAELEKELETRSGEVRELTTATLLLLRRKLDQERQLERAGNGFGT